MPTAAGFVRGSACLATGLLLLASGGCGSDTTTSSSSDGGTVPASSSEAKTPSRSASSADYAKLVGRWQRTDAEYVIEVKSCEAGTGRMEAAYFNPNPIHVAKAEAKVEGGKTQVFVELQDTGYPGCTYRLSYFPQTDQLYGVYYQAAIDQSFDVEFERQK